MSGLALPLLVISRSASLRRPLATRFGQHLLSRLISSHPHLLPGPAALASRQLPWQTQPPPATPGRVASGPRHDGADPPSPTTAPSRTLPLPHKMRQPHSCCCCPRSCCCCWVAHHCLHPSHSHHPCVSIVWQTHHSCCQCRLNGHHHLGELGQCMNCHCAQAGRLLMESD